MMAGRRDRGWLAIAATLLGVVVAATMAGACGSSGDAAAPSPSATAAGVAVSRDDVVAFVNKAVAYAEKNGKEAALAAFNDPQGEFQVGELYIFAYDFSGRNLAHYDQSLVGKDLIDLRDPNGKPIIRDFVGIARNGSGWLSYVWANPADDDRPEAKIGYITRVDDDWLLGAGTYGPAAQQTPGASPSP
ncbi:MAG: cache domain-containing protein [Actinomycetes bacterium]